MSDFKQNDQPAFILLDEYCSPHKDFIGDDDLFIWMCGRKKSPDIPCSYRGNIGNILKVCLHPGLKEAESNLFD